MNTLTESLNFLSNVLHSVLQRSVRSDKLQRWRSTGKGTRYSSWWIPDKRELLLDIFLAEKMNVITTAEYSV